MSSCGGYQMKKVVLILFVFALYSFAQNVQVSLLSGADGVLKTKIEQGTSQFLNEIESKGHQGSSVTPIKSLTPEGLQSLQELWASEAFYPIEFEIYGNLLKTPSGFQLRDVPVQLFKSKTSEELVISYNSQGLITDIRFAVTQHQYAQVMNSGKSVTDFRRRQYVLDFVENFRTAYNRKDLSFIRKVFSDNALIIVGKVLQDVPNTEGTTMGLDSKRVVLVTTNKKQYLSQLESTFKRNQSIRVTYDSISVQQHPHPNKEEWYGVTLKQHWVSTQYSDTGYVFLLIDFTNEQTPTIWVRSWQPSKVTMPADVLSLGDFEIVE